MRYLNYFVAVEIDGEPHLLIPVFSGNGQWQYNTEGNKSAHQFSVPLSSLLGKSFRTNGHEYKIIKEIRR
jgi:hypothetical protein